MNVEYRRSWGFTPGYVRDSNDFTPCDPSNDVYAFGVTYCQVCLDSSAVEYFSEHGTFYVVFVNRSRFIASTAEDIKACLSQLLLLHEDCNREGSENPNQISRILCRKFFPNKRPPPPFIQKIFDLVEVTCSIPTYQMDDVIGLLERASDVLTRCNQFAL